MLNRPRRRCPASVFSHPSLLVLLFVIPQGSAVVVVVVVVVAFAVALAFLSVIPGELALSEVEWEICFYFLPLQLFSSKTAQKSHVKPPDRSKAS
jgi:hypothetical protein